MHADEADPIDRPHSPDNRIPGVIARAWSGSQNGILASRGIPRSIGTCKALLRQMKGWMLTNRHGMWHRRDSAGLE
jgi:hypothetical protein